MRYDRDIHHRRSIRLTGYDYSAAGVYFVTICVHGRECLFDEMADGVMRLNTAGQVVQEEWSHTPGLRPQVSLDVFVVMPNHIHGPIVLNCGAVGAYCNTPLPNGTPSVTTKQVAPLRSPSQTIGAIVRGFKSSSTKRINQMRGNPGRPVWQRNYYERIIRNERELDAARKYVVENPIKWHMDRENPVNAP